MTFDPTSLATLGGALALIGGLVGSSIGIAKAASAGTATLSEDSGQFRNVIVLSSLPMTQSFYGLIILILIITAVVPKVEAGGSGMAVLGIGLIGFLAELFSSIYQGSIRKRDADFIPRNWPLPFGRSVLKQEKFGLG